MCWRTVGCRFYQLDGGLSVAGSTTLAGELLVAGTSNVAGNLRIDHAANGTTSSSTLLEVTSTNAPTLANVTNIAGIFTLNVGEWRTLIADVNTVANLSLNFIQAIAGGLVRTFPFTSANTNETGIFPADTTIVRDNLYSAYWYYTVVNSRAYAYRLVFRLNGNALEYRQQDLRSRGWAVREYSSVKEQSTF